LQSIHDQIATAATTAVAKGANALTEKHVEQKAKSCFVQLLAVLATDHETIDVRFRHPQRKLNHVIKGIVQTKSRTQDYPYLNQGLDGTNQVVGLVSCLVLCTDLVELFLKCKRLILTIILIFLFHYAGGHRC
jgi:hypothetical protein